MFESLQPQRRNVFEAAMQQLLLVTAAEELAIHRIVQKVSQWVQIDLDGRMVM